MHTKLYLAILLSASVCFSDSQWESLFPCGPGIDYSLEGAWWNDGNGFSGYNGWWWQWENNTSVKFAKTKKADVFAEIRDAAWEKGDLHYRRLHEGGSEGEWHSEPFGAVEITEGGDTPTVYGFASVGCQDVVYGDCLADATKTKTYTLDPIDFTLSTPNLYKSIEASQASLIDKFSSEGSIYYRGVRSPSTYSLSEYNRELIISNAKSIVNHDIDYTWADMLENKWSYWCGWYPCTDQDWDGSVGDIDEIRCDGVGEYSYENKGFRVWGTDTEWNAGSGNDHNLNEHNELWEHIFGYDLGELSPVIQAGCGGYGNGARTTLSSKSYINKPMISDPYIYPIGGGGDYNVWFYDVYDEESENVYLTVQVLDNNQWHTIKDINSKIWKNVKWAGGEGINFSIRAVPYTYNLYPNQKWRIIAIDEGMNSSITEYITSPSLPSNGQHVYEYIVKNNGWYEFILGNIPSGSDFDIQIRDNRNGAIIAGSYNGGDSYETVSFFAQEHSSLSIEIYPYSGAGGYNFFLNNFIPATVYNIDTPYSIDASGGNSTIEIPNLPSSDGWGIAWGDPTSIDIDLEIVDGSTVLSGSYSGSPSEYVRGDFAGKKLRIFRYSDATSFGPYEVKIFKLEY